MRSNSVSRISCSTTIYRIQQIKTVQTPISITSPAPTPISPKTSLTWKLPKLTMTNKVTQERSITMFPSTHHPRTMPTSGQLTGLAATAAARVLGLGNCSSVMSTGMSCPMGLEIARPRRSGEVVELGAVAYDTKKPADRVLNLQQDVTISEACSWQAIIIESLSHWCEFASSVSHGR